MKRSGSADLALMGGRIPSWLFQRMVKLSLPIVESIIMEYGKEAFLQRIADPFWFQSFGAVIGMDWNSSGVTTAVMGALKYSLAPHSKRLGVYICGGKGKKSLQTPNELMRVGDKTGLDGTNLAAWMTNITSPWYVVIYQNYQTMQRLIIPLYKMAFNCIYIILL